MTVVRDAHTATLLRSGKVLIASGDGANGVLSGAELYDPAAGTFAATGSLTVARMGHTATLLSSGEVLIAGGTADMISVLASAELYQ